MTEIGRLYYPVFSLFVLTGIHSHYLVHGPFAVIAEKLQKQSRLVYISQWFIRRLY
jgi:hypothetical protein